MKSGTAKKRKYFPIKDVYSKLPLELESALVAFHSLSGCDTTFYFAGHSKTTAYRTFRVNYKLYP